MGNGAQRIPSWPGALAPTKAEYICADQPVTLTFRLRQGGGPYKWDGPPPFDFRQPEVLTVSKEASHGTACDRHRFGQDGFSSCWFEPDRRDHGTEEVLAHSTSSFHCERASSSDWNGSLPRLSFSG